jgi:hypothetical protein
MLRIWAPGKARAPGRSRGIYAPESQTHSDRAFRPGTPAPNSGTPGPGSPTNDLYSLGWSRGCRTGLQTRISFQTIALSSSPGGATPRLASSLSFIPILTLAHGGIIPRKTVRDEQCSVIGDTGMCDSTRMRMPAG